MSYHKVHAGIGTCLEQGHRNVNVFGGGGVSAKRKIFLKLKTLESRV